MALDVAAGWGGDRGRRPDAPLTRIPLRAAAAACAAGLFALANYAPRRVVLLQRARRGTRLRRCWTGCWLAGVSRATATAGAAILMGVGCHVLAGRARIAPLLLLVPAIIPQLPGLTIFRALQALTAGEPGWASRCCSVP